MGPSAVTYHVQICQAEKMIGLMKCLSAQAHAKKEKTQHIHIVLRGFSVTPWSRASATIMRQVYFQIIHHQGCRQVWIPFSFTVACWQSLWLETPLSHNPKGLNVPNDRRCWLSFLHAIIIIVRSSSGLWDALGLVHLDAVQLSVLILVIVGFQEQQ